MIQILLRSTLVFGTVLLNAFTLGTPGDPVHTTFNPASNLAPISWQPSPRLTDFQPLAAATPQKPAPARKKFKLASLRNGLATWYGKVLNQHKTASGEVFDCSLLTGASNTLPFGTRVKVTNLRNGMSVVVRVNDRGVFNPGNIIDLSSAAAEQIDLLRMGIAPVHLDILRAAL